MGFGSTGRAAKYATALAVIVIGAGVAAPAQARQLPSAGTSLESELYGVSCSTASACTAVGDQETGARVSAPLAERWNGTAWTVQSTANPSGATSSYLLGTSCVSATACTAVGYALNSTYTTLAEGWNGTSWTIRATPTP
jgi:hypothetical protein